MNDTSLSPKEVWNVKAKLEGVNLQNGLDTLSCGIWTIKNVANLEGVEIEGKFSFQFGVTDGFQEGLNKFWIFLGCLIGNVPEINICDSWNLSSLDINLVNFSELILQGLKPPTKLSFNSKTTLTLSDENLKSIANEFDILINQHTSTSLVLQQMLRYFAKAQTQSNPQDRFIWNWLALNIAYNHNSPHSRTEIAKLKELGSKGFDREDAKYLVDIFSSPNSPILKTGLIKIELGLLGFQSPNDLLISLNLLSWNGEKNRSEELKNAIIDKVDVKIILQKILLCLFQVRSQLLHGITDWVAYSGTRKLDILSKFLGVIVHIQISTLARKCGLS